MNVIFRRRKYFILGIIFLLALFLRLIHLEDRIQWLGDTARDYLVATLHTKQHTVLDVGPYASGFNYPFYYPPLYYYLMASIISINGSILFFVSFVAFLQCIGVLAAYKIGEIVDSNLSGYLSALIIGVSLSSIKLASTVHGAIVALPILLIALVFYLKGLKTNNIITIWAGFLFLQLSSVISYTIVIVFGILFIYWLLYSNKSLFTKIGLTVILSLQYYLLIYSLINYFGWSYLIQVVNPFYNFTDKTDYLISFKSVFTTYTDLLFNFDPNTKVRGIFILGCLFLLFIINRQINVIKNLMPIILSIFTLFLAGVFRGNNFLLHWSFAGFLLILISISVFLASLVVSTKGISKIITIAVTIIWVMLLAQPSEYKYLKDDSLSSSKSLYSYLVNKYGQNDNYHVYILDEHGTDWESMKIWVFYEQNGNSYYELTNEGKNIRYINQHPSKYIIICTKTLSQTGNCQDTVATHYAGLDVISKEVIDNQIIFTLSNSINL